MAGINRTPADIAFSNCVRERASWHCERCAKYFPEGNRGGLDCSHHHSRGNWAIRFEPLNAEALCYGCHAHVGGTEERRAEVLSTSDRDLLYKFKNDIERGRITRKTKGKGEIAKHYRNELARMQRRRAHGDTGIIEFVGWY